MHAGAMQPVAVGGVGGGGTRVVATLLDMLGYFIGDDLNVSLDNLWFTLLFKRRSILLESDASFRELVSLFFSRMSGRLDLSDAARGRLFELAEQDRLQHPSGWLTARAASFAGGQTAKRPGQPWGWKEPNTHVVIDRIFSAHADLRYIHVVRHPLDMAISQPQNQLEFWGPVFLDRDVAVEPRQSLSYWCAVHRRALDFLRSWPERTLMIEFDALCAAPDEHAAKIAEFLGAAPSDKLLADFRAFVRPPPSAGRFRGGDLGVYDPADLAYVAQLGYAF
jgi:hypothetical protein